MMRITRWIVTQWIVMLAVASLGSAIALADPTPATQPDPKLTANSSVDQILDALDAVGKNLKDFKADVSQGTLDQISGDSTTDVGNVIFRRKGDNDQQIRVTFTKKIIGDTSNRQDHEYTLANGLLIDRDFKFKKEVDRQVLKPGEKMDLFKLGVGPFPLPIGQDKATVENLFNVTKAAPAKDDPRNCVHITLIPVPKSAYFHKFNQLDIFVDLSNSLPRRIVQTPYSAGGPAASLKITDLTNWRINIGVTDGDFSERPTGPDWQKTTEEFQE